MDENEIKRLIDVEIARRRVAGELAKAGKKGGGGAWLRHPLFLTVFAFLVTTGIGGYYDSVLTERAEAREAEAAKHTRAEAREGEAILELQSFVTLVYTRAIRSDLLRSSIVRGSARETPERKQAYDAVFVTWNVELPQNLLMLRELIGVEGRQTVYERAVEQLIAPGFRRVDGCLTKAYDSAVEANYAGLSTDYRSWQCHNLLGRKKWTSMPRGTVNRIRECAHAIMSNMISEIRALTDAEVMSGTVGTEETARIEALIETALLESCPGMTAAGQVAGDEG